MIDTSHLWARARAGEVTAEKLLRDVRLVVRGAEELIKATAGDAGDKTREARARLAATVAVTRETCDRLEALVLRHSSPLNRLLRSYPLQSVGLAFGVGLIAGFLTRRR